MVTFSSKCFQLGRISVFCWEKKGLKKLLPHVSSQKAPRSAYKWPQRGRVPFKTLLIQGLELLT